jgi:plastocyanin
MRRHLAMLLACCSPLLLAACGSGSSATTASTAGGKPAGTQTGSLKVATTPKFGSPPASAPVQSGLVQIAYRDIAIHPDTIQVRAGSTIRWTNYDSVEHNVTSVGGSQSFRSGNFGEGASYEVKLTRPGIIHYLCTNHPASMNGTIAVVP